MSQLHRRSYDTIKIRREDSSKLKNNIVHDIAVFARAYTTELFYTLDE